MLTVSVRQIASTRKRPKTLFHRRPLSRRLRRANRFASRACEDSELRSSCSAMGRSLRPVFVRVSSLPVRPLIFSPLSLDCAGRKHTESGSQRRTNGNHIVFFCLPVRASFYEFSFGLQATRMRCVRCLGGSLRRKWCQAFSAGGWVVADGHASRTAWVSSMGPVFLI